MKYLSCVLVLVAGVVALTLSGCSGKKQPDVKGTVTVDGKTPLAHALLEFEAVDPTTTKGGATVTTDENGQFEIDKDRKKAGMQPGKYRVLVSKWVDPKTGQPPEEEDGLDFEQLKESGALRNVVHPRYSSREFPEHLLEVEVTEGENDLKIDVKSK